MFGLARAFQSIDRLVRGPVGPKLPKKGSIEISRIC